jgi:hypothetical protein
VLSITQNINNQMIVPFVNNGLEIFGEHFPMLESVIFLEIFPFGNWNYTEL